MRGPKGLERGGVLGERQRAPSRQLRVWEALYKLPHRGPGGAPENVEFSEFWDLKVASRQCKKMGFAQVFQHMGHKK